MNKTLFFAIASLILTVSCKENVEKMAERHLNNAKEAFSKANYSLAKQEIDSIRILYPKAFETRKQGIALMQEVEEAEQLRTIEYEDSMIALTQSVFMGVREKYVFEKDERYQDIGIYTISSQATARNTDRNYIRAQVDELGHMNLISQYRGSSFIHHDRIRFEVGETYVETPESDDRHEFSNLGVCYESLSFLNGNDGGAAAFIKVNRDKEITYTLYTKTGPDSSRPVFRNLRMTKDDRDAIAQLYDLSQILLSLNEHKNLRDEAERHLRFIRSRMKEEVSTEQAVQEY